MVYGPSFLYFEVSTATPASRARFCEYAAVGAVVAAGLAAAAVVGTGAVVGAVVAAGLGAAVAGGAVAGAAAVVGAGPAGAADEHALAINAPAASMPLRRRTSNRCRIRTV